MSKNLRELNSKQLIDLADQYVIDNKFDELEKIKEEFVYRIENKKNKGLSPTKSSLFGFYHVSTILNTIFSSTD